MTEGNQYLQKGHSDQYRDNFDEIFKDSRPMTDEERRISDKVIELIINKKEK